MGMGGNLRVLVSELEIPRRVLAIRRDDTLAGGCVGKVGVLEAERAEEAFLHHGLKGLALDGLEGVGQKLEASVGVGGGGERSEGGGGLEEAGKEFW